MKKLLLATFAGSLLLAAMAVAAVAQESASGTMNTLSLDPRQNADMTNSAGTETGQPNEMGDGTMNTLSLDPRQNAEMTHSTGTESGQPNDVVAGSNNQENGLIPVTTNMMGSGSSGSATPAPSSTASKTSSTSSASKTQSSTKPPPKSAPKPQK